MAAGPRRDDAAGLSGDGDGRSQANRIASVAAAGLVGTGWGDGEAAAVPLAREGGAKLAVEGDFVAESTPLHADARGIALAARRTTCYHRARPRSTSPALITRLYDWTMDLAARPRALWLLALISFTESSFFPIPPDVMLIPMVLAAPTRAWRIAAMCTAGSVLGGAFGYLIGVGAFAAIGRPLLEFYGYIDQFEEYQALYRTWGMWIVSVAGFTPLPYKVISITSGVMRLDVATFLLVSAASRGLRFFIVAALLWYFGEPIRRFIEGHLAMLATLFLVLLLGGFVVIRFVF